MSQVLIVSPAAAQLAALIRPLPEGVSVATAETAADAMAHAAEATVLVAMPHHLTKDLIAAMPGLRWIQTLTSGIDALARLDLDPAIAITTGRGIHGPQISELVFLYMLAFTRDLRGVLTRQAAAVWQPGPQRMLAGRRLVILGIGAISEALAARAQAFGMRVTGVSGSRDTAPGFDAVLPLHRLVEAAAEADFLVVLTPLSPATTGIVDAAVLAAMPSTAVLINVARGKVVDQAALADALATGRIAGAGLDVFEVEPLPADSPIWKMDNAIVTPHVAGWSDIFIEQLGPVVAGNIERWFAQPPRPLRNVAKQ